MTRVAMRSARSCLTGNTLVNRTSPNPVQPQDSCPTHCHAHVHSILRAWKKRIQSNLPLLSLISKLRDTRPDESGVGSGSHGRQDGQMPLAEVTTCRTDGVC